MNVSSGEIPLYTEARSKKCDELVSYLKKNKIETSKFHLSLNRAQYLENKDEFPNASVLASECFILPSGPSQPLNNVYRCIDYIKKWNR